MKKYAVTLNNKRLNHPLLVVANHFTINYLSSHITFIDEKGNNVALFNKMEVSHINVIQEKGEVPNEL